MAFINKSYSPHQSLSSIIDAYTYFEVSSNSTKAVVSDYYSLPSIFQSLIFYEIPLFKARGVLLAGANQFINKSEVISGMRVIGIRFKPDVIQSIFGVNGELLANKSLKDLPRTWLNHNKLFDAFQHSNWVNLLNKLFIDNQLMLSPPNKRNRELFNTILKMKTNLDEPLQPNFTSLENATFKKSVGFDISQTISIHRFNKLISKLDYRNINQLGKQLSEQKLNFDDYVKVENFEKEFEFTDFVRHLEIIKNP